MAEDKDSPVTFTLKQVVSLIVGVIVVFGGFGYISKDNTHHNKQTTINVSEIKSLEEKTREQNKRIERLESRMETFITSMHGIDTKVSVMKESTESLKKQNSLMLTRQSEMISAVRDIQKHLK